jgi:CHAT domain-containing protein
MAVLDPTGDRKDSADLLERAPDLADRAEVVLGSAAARPADAATITAVLGEMSEGRPGVLLWAGHAEPGPGGRPLEAYLPLTLTSDGAADQRLTVGDLLLNGLHAPSRAVLHGCTTVGVDDALNEWWGFPVALVFAGASAVAATAWDVLDTPASVQMAAEVLRAAADADDLATALQEVQVRWLRQWSAQRAGGRPLRRDESDRHPHLWAAWMVVGTHYG